MSGVDGKAKFRRRTAAVALAAGACLTAAMPARAHHVLSESGFTAAPTNQIALSLEAARFHLPDGNGWYESAVLFGEHAPVPWLSAQVRLPFHRLTVGGQPAATGVGDVDLALKLSLLRSPHETVAVSAGLGAGLPTGNDRNGIGAGHVDLTPFVTAALAYSDFVLFGSLGDRVSLGGHHGGVERESLVFPHSDHELAFRLGLGRTISPLRASLSLDGVTVLAAEGRGDLLLAAAGEVGWRLAPEALLGLVLELPATSRRRADGRGRLVATFFF